MFEATEEQLAELEDYFDITRESLLEWLAECEKDREE